MIVESGKETLKPKGRDLYVV